MQTPEPESVPAATEKTVSELENRLDGLWESYLTLLDGYTKAQDEIKKHLNSGFLSLAKAQSSAPLGRRYGQDWYDERMKAEKRVHVSGETAETGDDAITAVFQSLRISLAQTTTKTDSNEAAKESTHEGEEPQPTQQPSPPGTPDPEDREKSTEDKKPTEDEKTEVAEKAKPVNPLRWYGVLVPPELRKAQSAFSAVIDDPINAGEQDVEACDDENSPITGAVNAARGLREIEGEIRRVRKALKKAEKARIAATS
ncbi:hypothetical protein Q7P35_008698 [Cladosporium inversicolor]